MRRPRPRRRSTSWSPTCRASPGAAWRPATSPRNGACARSTSWRRSRRSFPVDKLERRDQVLRGAAGGRRAGQSRRLVRAGAAPTARKKLPELFAPAIAIARDGFQLIEFNLEEIQRRRTASSPATRRCYPEWSRVYIGGPSGSRLAGLRAEAARSRTHARGAGQRRPRPALWRRARPEDPRPPERARRLPRHGRPQGGQARPGAIRWRSAIAATASTCRRRPARDSSTC